MHICGACRISRIITILTVIYRHMLCIRLYLSVLNKVVSECKSFFVSLSAP